MQRINQIKKNERVKKCNPEIIKELLKRLNLNPTMVAKAFLGNPKPSVDLVKKWTQNGRIHEKWMPEFCRILSVSEKMITGDAVILVMIGPEYQVVHDLLTQSIETNSPKKDKKWLVKSSVLNRIKKQMSHRRRFFDKRPTVENGGKPLRAKM